MPGTRWGDLRTSQHSAGRTNSEYRATQLQLLKAREWAARFSPFETPGEKRHRAQWEKLERRAERELERRSLGSRGSARTERSRPATVPSEPSPSTIDSAQRPGSGYRYATSTPHRNLIFRGTSVTGRSCVQVLAPVDQRLGAAPGVHRVAVAAVTADDRTRLADSAAGHADPTGSDPAPAPPKDGQGEEVRRACERQPQGP